MDVRAGWETKMLLMWLIQFSAVAFKHSFGIAALWHCVGRQASAALWLIVAFCRSDVSGIVIATMR
jgi:hypothetical protein